MNIASEETQAKVTADEVASILGVGEMTDEQRKAVEGVLAKAGGGGGERTTKDRAARPMDTQRAARRALETQQQKGSVVERGRHAPTRPSRPSGPRRP